MQTIELKLPDNWKSLAQAFVHTARTHAHLTAIIDSTGTKLTYEQTLVRAIALANILTPILAESRFVGVMLPPSAGAALVNLALALLGRVAVNLNYSATQETLESCARRCNLQQTITGKRLLEHLKFTPPGQILCAEDLQHNATLALKALSWSEAELVPEKLLGAFFPGLSETPVASSRSGNTARSINRDEHPRERVWLDETAALLFTTGSTGEPKGVLLSHRNILSNIYAIKLHAEFESLHVVLGILPFFHSFGFTLNLWGPLVLGHTVIYHYDPFDSRKVCDLCQKHEATVLFCTPTVLRACTRRGKSEQLKSLSLCIVGGEKLSPQLAEDVKSKFGLTVYEGYGLTETSPVIACNVPWEFKRNDGSRAIGYKPGTVGRPLPGTKIKIDCSANADHPEEGMIMVHGPQVMQGYLNDDRGTQEVLHDGWFTTGDLGFLDQDGFLSITGRLSQFSKIGGEMVPHIAIEQEILNITQGNEASVCVTSVPDPNRGERLAVVYNNWGDMTPEAVVEALRKQSICKLWIPDSRDFVKLEQLPTLPSGKLDMQKIKTIAASKLNGD